MAILTEDMLRVVREQRLGFHATVCEDGTPNLSPTGTTDVWDDVSPAHDDGTLTEADIRAIHQARFARLHAPHDG